MTLSNSRKGRLDKWKQLLYYLCLQIEKKYIVMSFYFNDVYEFELINLNLL